MHSLRLFFAICMVFFTLSLAACDGSSSNSTSNAGGGVAVPVAVGFASSAAVSTDGFLNYGAIGSSVLLQASLKSISELGGGVLIGDDTGAASFDASLGACLNGTAAIEYTIGNESASLASEGHLSVQVTSDYIDYQAIPAFDEILLHLETVPGSVYLYKSSSDGSLGFWVGSPGQEKARITPVGKGSQVRIDLSWNASMLQLYVDYLLVLETAWSGATDLARVRLGGFGNAGYPAPATSCLSDLQIAMHEISLPAHQNLQHVNIYGDSFTRLGQYPSSDLAILGRTEDGSAGQQFDAVDINRDAGMLPTLHRELSRTGAYVGNNRIYFWGRGGSRVRGISNSLGARIDASLNGYPVPDVAVISIGTNDISALSVDPGWKTAYEFEIDKLLSNGCKKIIIANVSPLNPESRFNSTAYDQLTDLANSYLDEIGAGYPEVTVVDVFTKFGGHTGFDPADFGLDDRHPSTQGQYKIGRWLSDALSSSINPPPSTPVDLTGTIKTAAGLDICAMVLASGQYMFSCNPDGVFSLGSLPRESDGTVKRQIYADGFFPKIDVLTDSSLDEAVVMTQSGSCPSYNAPYSPGLNTESAGKWIDIQGNVMLQNSQTPVCAMVLANGQHMFSCDGTGSYDLHIPLDINGQYKLQVYADGFAPAIQTFDEFSVVNDVKMARAVECQLP